MSIFPTGGRKIILASGSPRRRDLLAGAGIEFEALATDADESVKSRIAPDR